MKKFFIISFFTLAMSPCVIAKTKLSLKQGTMQAGGHMQMPITIPKEQSAIVGLDISPKFAYFFARSFAVGILASIGKKSITGENLPWSFKFGLNGTYYFDVGGTIYPYLGAGASIAWQTKIDGIRISVSAPVGMLVALNSFVAIDFGVPVEFHFNNEGYLGTLLPVGYAGVQMFF